jgi:hypothetical protein
MPLRAESERELNAAGGTLPMRWTIAAVVIAVGCAKSDSTRDRSTSDSAFASLQARGERAMGVDQYSSTHLFIPLADGGRIELQRDAADLVGERTIRGHMGDIATRFAAGDFRIPGVVHATSVVPGTDVMRARRERISYTVEELPRGAALRIGSNDSAAVRAIHDFLAFQRGEHRAGGAH